MMNSLLSWACLCLAFPAPPDPISLFDGKTFAGWEGDTKDYWRIENGAITAGSLERAAPRNDFLATTRKFEHFDLRLKFKITGSHNVNAGVQFRTRRIPDHHEVSGYQADIGPAVDGHLYDESRRGRNLAVPDKETLKKAQAAVGKDGWNSYRIRAEGSRIRLWLNGVQTVDFVEKDASIPQTGIIALQIHGGMKAVIGYKEIELDVLPAPSALSAPVPQEVQQGPRWSERIAAVDPGSRKERWARPDFNSEHWKKMEQPTLWEEAGLPGYDGVVWFRKQFALPASLVGKKAVLSLGPIDDMDVTWVNGKRVGGHEKPGDHYTPRVYPVPAGLLAAGKNVIAVRVMDHGWPGGFGGKLEQLVLRVGKEKISLAGTWRYRPGADLATLKQVTFDGNTPRVARPLPGFKDGFALVDGDTVAFAGGTDVVKQQEESSLETLLTRMARGRKIRFRNVAWQADTVYRRQRPRNFGTQLDLLLRINATIVVAAFGQMEALDGKERLPEFIQAYETLLDEYARRTDKIVLVTPRPFGHPRDLPHVPDLRKHNGVVAAYAAAIAKLAGNRGYPCVDLSKTSVPTRDGVHLTMAGQRQVAGVMASQLLGRVVPGGELTALRREIRAKNRLWEQHWRPTNWSFVYGNRQHVPSSRDHVDPSKRWFPGELAGILPVIEEAERKIHEMAGR